MIHPTVRKARIAEIQAIAIYQAELYWIRNSQYREILKKIYLEEIDHDNALAHYAPVHWIHALLNKVAGWIVGTLLSLLPWRQLCRVQAWAENQAAEIYRQALGNVEAHSELGVKLAHAQKQELEHAIYFNKHYRAD